MELAETEAIGELQRLVEELTLATELGQQAAIQEVCLKAHVVLLELLDADLASERKTAHEEQANWREQAKRLVKSLTDELKQWARLAGAFKAVQEFVHLADMFCLAEMLEFGSRRAGISKQLRLAYDLDGMRLILRKSIFLLEPAIVDDDNSAGWLNRRRLRRSQGVGLPVHRIIMESLEGKSARSESSREQATGAHRATETSTKRLPYGEQVKALANLDGPDPKTALGKVVRMDWFQDFVASTLDKTIPIDKFTVIVAIWIIGVQCEHHLVCQLMSELVDEMLHDEANSCSVDELMQLTQVGSFWLSHQRRYLAIPRRHESSLLMEANNVDESDDSDEASRSSSSASSSSSSPSQSGDNTRARGDRTQDREVAIPSSLSQSSRRQLRGLIDRELLYGWPCPACGHSSSQLLDPIKLKFCPSCSHRTMPLRCAISFKPLPLVSLRALNRAARWQDEMIFVSASEWARRMFTQLQASLIDKPERETRLKEHFDVADKFQRLTVIRDDEEETPIQQATSPANLSMDEEKSMQTSDEPEALRLATLDDFLRRRNDLSSYSDWGELEAGDRPSESACMLRYWRAEHLGATSMIPPVLCSADLLIWSAFSNMLDLRLCLSLEVVSGELWSCSQRSPISGLLVGCASSFLTIELIRTGHPCRKSPPAECPFCGCELTLIRSLQEASNLDTLGR